MSLLDWDMSSPHTGVPCASLAAASSIHCEKCERPLGVPSTIWVSVGFAPHPQLLEPTSVVNPIVNPVGSGGGGGLGDSERLGEGLGEGEGDGDGLGSTGAAAGLGGTTTTAAAAACPPLLFF